MSHKGGVYPLPFVSPPDPSPNTNNDRRSTRRQRRHVQYVASVIRLLNLVLLSLNVTSSSFVSNFLSTTGIASFMFNVLIFGLTYSNKQKRSLNINLDPFSPSGSNFVFHNINNRFVSDFNSLFVFFPEARTLFFSPSAAQSRALAHLRKTVDMFLFSFVENRSRLSSAHQSYMFSSSRGYPYCVPEVYAIVLSSLLTPSSCSSSFFSRSSRSLASFSPNQRSNLIARPVSVSVLPSSDGLTPPSLFSFLLHSPSPIRDSYVSTPALLPVIADRVSLPDSVACLPLVNVLPVGVAAFYSTPSRFLLSSSERDRLLSKSQLPVRPRCLGSKKEYIKLVKRMIALGMLGITTEPLVVNGLFAVEKDENSDRLIIDARIANCYFVLPPHTKLPSPSHLVSLVIPRGYVLRKSKCDLSNFYHNLLLPACLTRYFCLPRLPAKLFGVTGDADGFVYPMCLTLPMGWSHSVFVAQCVHEYVLYSSGVVSPLRNVINLSSPLLSPGVPVHGAYIDDLFIIGVVPITSGTGSLQRLLGMSTGGVDELHQKVLAAYVAAGLPVKMSKVIAPTCDPVVVLGILLGECYVMPDPNKLCSLVGATLALLVSGFDSGLSVSRVVGSWTWFMMLNRPLLSVFKNVYRFIVIANSRSIQLWPSVRKELALVLCLAPLMSCDLSGAFVPVLGATDASEFAAGGVVTDMDSELGYRLWPLAVGASHLSHVKAESERWGTPFTDMCVGGVSTCTLSQPSIHLLPGIVTPPSFLFQLRQRVWRIILSHPWCDQSEHINTLELRALVLFVRWLLSSPRTCHGRVFVLVDSAVLFSAIRKGRSSSRSLCSLLRVLCCLQLSCGLTIVPVWVPSKWNPADRPSRIRSILSPSLNVNNF